MQLMVKRGLDILVATTALILLSPLWLLMSGAILATMGRPVLFRQVRLGYLGRPFVILKFRTMIDANNRRGRLLPDGERLTGLGRFLRRSTLDELPELLNVIRGDMSLVGPRPLLPEYRDRYSPEQWRRHSVRPGMAGPVMAGGRNALSWGEKFALDLWYVDHWSLGLDLRLFGRSVWNLLTGRGVSAEGHATMPPFEGAGTGRSP